MGMFERYSWKLFWVICVVITVVLISHVSRLWPLYIDSHLRTRVQHTIEQEAQRRGWLLSGVSIQSLDADTVTVLYREYRRGSDPVMQYHLPITAQ